MSRSTLMLHGQLKGKAPLSASKHSPLSVNLQDVRAALDIRKTELNLTVKSSGTEKGGVESVRTIGGHDDLDVSTGVESIKLVDELQHGSLNLVVTTSSVIETGSTDSVNLIKEDDTRLL